MSAFTFTGEFAGFIHLPNGKRRLLLRTHEQELLFKVPKELRQEMAGQLEFGVTITLRGVEEEDEGHHRRLVVSSVHFDDGAAGRGACTVRVCSKKNCWKSGNRELAHLLEREVQVAGLSHVVRLKLSGCLDCCKHAPVIACGNHVIRHCNAREVRALVARLRTRYQEE